MHYTSKQAAERLNITIRTFQNLVRRGMIPQPVKILGRKVWLRKDIDNLFTIGK